MPVGMNRSDVSVRRV